MKANALIRKVILWRLISITITLFVIYVYTGDIKSATGITIFLHALLTVIHGAYEQAWLRYYERR